MVILIFLWLALGVQSKKQNNYNHCLAFTRMKADNYRKKLEKQITQNYNILKQLLNRQQFSLLVYEEIVFIILGGNVEATKISYFRNKKYGSQAPALGSQYLIRDALDLKKQIVAKAWRFQKAFDRGKTMQMTRQKKPSSLQKSNNQATESQQNIVQPQSIQESKERQQQESQTIQMKDKKRQQKISKKLRILQIEQMLTNLQMKLNTTKNEEEAAQYQNQYNKLFKQLTFLRNKKRIERQENIMKRISTQNQSFVSKKVNNLIEKINEVKRKNSKILDKLPRYQQKMTKSQEVTRLHTIFNFYSKKQTDVSNRYFSDLQKDQNKLKLQTFIKFAQQWELHRIVPIQKISSIFKSHSKGNRFINSLQFAQILSDIHNLECINEEKPISNQSLSQYIQEYIVCDAKINKIILNSGQFAKKQGSIEYKFKPKSHSGKYLKDIEEDLQDRKKTLDFLAGPKNNPKFNHLKKARSRNVTMQNSRVEPEEQPSTVENVYNPSINLNDSVNSYAFRFKLKNTKNRIKTQGLIRSHQMALSTQKSQIDAKVLQSNRENIDNRPETIQKVSEYHKKSGNKISQPKKFNLEGETDEETRPIAKGKQRNKQHFEGFQQLIQESEEDEYLNKHLFPPIKQNRLPNKIHF